MLLCQKTREVMIDSGLFEDVHRRPIALQSVLCNTGWTVTVCSHTLHCTLRRCYQAPADTQYLVVASRTAVNGKMHKMQ